MRTAAFLLVAWLAFFFSAVLAAENTTTTITLGNFIANNNRLDTVDDNGNTIGTSARYRNLNLNPGSGNEPLFKVTNNDSVSHIYVITFELEGTQAKGSKWQGGVTVPIGTVAAGQTVEMAPSSAYNTRMHCNNGAGSGDAGTWGHGDTVSGSVRLRAVLTEDGEEITSRTLEWQLGGTIWYGSSTAPSNTYGSRIVVEFESDESPSMGYVVNPSWTFEEGFEGTIFVTRTQGDLDPVVLFELEIPAGGLSYSTPISGLEQFDTLSIEPGTGEPVISSGTGAVFVNTTPLSWPMVARLWEPKAQRDVRLDAVNMTPGDVTVEGIDERGDTVVTVDIPGEGQVANSDHSPMIGGDEIQFEVEGAEIEVLEEPDDLGGGLNNFSLVIKPEGSGPLENYSKSTATIYGENGPETMTVKSGSLGGQQFAHGYNSSAPFSPSVSSSSYISSGMDTLEKIDAAAGAVASNDQQPGPMAPVDQERIAEDLAEVSGTMEGIDDWLLSMPRPQPLEGLGSADTMVLWPEMNVRGLHFPAVTMDLTQPFVTLVRNLMYVVFSFLWMGWMFWVVKF